MGNMLYLTGLIKAVRDRFADKVIDVHVRIMENNPDSWDLQVTTKHAGRIISTVKKDGSDLKEQMDLLAKKVI